MVNCNRHCTKLGDYAKKASFAALNWEIWRNLPMSSRKFSNFSNLQGS